MAVVLLFSGCSDEEVPTDDSPWGDGTETNPWGDGGTADDGGATSGGTGGHTSGDTGSSGTSTPGGQASSDSTGGVTGGQTSSSEPDDTGLQTSTPRWRRRRARFSRRSSGSTRSREHSHDSVRRRRRPCR